MDSLWLKSAGIRALKTAAQVAIATIGTTAVFTDVDWRVVGGSVLLAAILSVLTSVGGLPEVKLEASLETASTKIEKQAQEITALKSTDKQESGQ